MAKSKSTKADVPGKFILLGFALIIGLTIYTVLRDRESISGNSSTEGNSVSQEIIQNDAVPSLLSTTFPDVDFSKSSIELEQILSGGPGRDGIPAISSPEFVSLDETEIPDTTRGVLVELDGEKRFYPYNILVWHEIVNDKIGDQALAVTFCPLCGSAVVYKGTTDGENEVEFGVSGFLWESNMVMYDRSDNPSFWSQSIGKSVAGELTGNSLEHMPFQLLELATIRSEHPDAVIMSTDTGINRDYTLTPYGNYDFDEDLYFPVSVNDSRFSAKEIFYVIPANTLEKTKSSVAFRIGEISNGDSVDNENLGLGIEKTDAGEVFAKDSNGEIVPGYYEMWFSWATQHTETGEVWEP